MTAMTKLIGTVCSLCLLGYVAFFAVVNSSIVTVTLWPQSAPLEAPLWLVSLVAFCIGLLIIALLASLRISALRLRLYRMKKRLDAEIEARAKDQQTAEKNQGSAHLMSENLKIGDDS